MDFYDLNASLADRIDELAHALLGEPNRQRSSKRGLRYGRRGSLKINLQGPKRGRWRDFETDEGGTPLDLIMRERCCDLISAADWASDWLGLAIEEQLPRRAPYSRRGADSRDEASEDAERKRKTAYGLQLFHEARPVDGTHGAAYLADREVFVPDGAPIKFHPSLKHTPSSQRLPGIVARVDGPDGKAIGIHRTFLDPGTPRKADVEPAKMALGTVSGGAVRLTPAGKTLLVAEGIETALSVWMATELPTWAALSTSGLRALELPEEVREVIICADNDRSGAGLDAANDAAERWTDEGRTVRGMMPPRRGDNKSTDFNDCVQMYGPDLICALIEAAPVWVAGLGKTRMVLDVLSRDLKPSEFVHYYVSSHNLAVGVAERCRALGLPAWVIRGRGADAPKRPWIEQDVPLLVIDADATVKLGLLLWGRIDHLALPVKRNAVITQAADKRFSKFSLIGSKNASDRDMKTAERLLEKVRRFIRALVAIHGAGQVLVDTNKPVRCALTGEDVKVSLPAGTDWEGATVASFGNIRGIDDWKDYDCVVTLGREQLPPDMAEGLARGFHCDDPDPLNLTGEYVEEVRGYRMADGTKVGTKVRVHSEHRALWSR